MDSLAGYIATFGAGVAAKYVEQYLRPKTKIRYWLFHRFIHTIPPDRQVPALNPALPAPAAANQAGVPAAPANFHLLTQSIAIQNFGRERADWVEIVHQQRPDFFQLEPALNFTESTNEAGQHTVRVQSLAPNEFFVIQFLCHTHMPTLLFIRSPEGHAKAMPWMTVRQYPRWVQMLMWLGMAIGAAFCAYWVIKGGIFLLRSVGAL